MDFGYLGTLEARVGDVPVALRRGLPQALLAALLVHRNQVLRSELLTDWLWPGHTRSNAANGLQVQISYLRRTLGLSSDPTARPALVTGSGGYGLMVEPGSVDVDRFSQVLAAATGGSDEAPAAQRLTELTRALGLWRGDPLADVPEAPYVAAEVARLTDLRLRIEEARTDALLDLGRHEEAIEPLQRAAREHPFRERLHAQLATALYRSDRQAEALRVLDDVRRTLRDELGVDPGGALQGLQSAMLRQDPSLRAGVTDRRGGVADTGTRPVVRATVPAATGQLIGRDEALAQVEDLLDRCRCVTITGPGGAGKTSVAVEAARRLGARSPVWFVELAPVADPAMLLGAVTEQLGASTAPSADPFDVISTALGGSAVLVLDNCEHVAGAAAQLASTLLRRCPDVRILATSRRRLAIAGETSLPLPALDVPPERTSPGAIAAAAAVRLFVGRARAVRPDFRLDAGNTAAVAAICRLVDGLPLAIELAAARVALLAPEGILRRLEAGADLLAGGDRDRAPRQRSIAAAIAWSYELLDPDARRMFDRLAVFHGRSSIEAATDVAGAGIDDPLSTLEALVDQSLVVSDGSYIRLLEPLRAFAAARLAERPEEEHAVRQAHARWFTADLGSEGISGSPGTEVQRQPADAQAQLERLTALRTAVPNLRAALRWAFAHEPRLGAELATGLTWFWAIEGASVEAQGWLEQAVRVPGIPVASRAWALRGAAIHAANRGDLLMAGERCAEAVAEFRRDGNRVGEAEALLQLGTVQWGQGDLATAAATHDRAVDIFAGAGILWGEAMARILRARTAVDARDADTAKRLDEAERVARESGRLQLLGVALEIRAKVAHDRGERRLAGELSQEALRCQQEVGYLEGVASAWQCRALVLTAEGEHDAAVEASCRGLRIALDIGHPAGAAEGSEVLATALLARGAGRQEVAWLLAVADELRDRHQLSVPAAHAARVAATRRALAPLTGGVAAAGPADVRLSRWLAEHDPAAVTVA